MSKAEVIAWLKSEQDPRGIANWKEHAAASTGLKSYGIGLTRLRRYAKQLGRDAKLAKQLWKSKVYDAKIVALLIDDPKTMTVEQAEAQVEQLQGGYLAHAFSSCDAPLAKALFARELAEKWIVSKDQVRKGCGYGLIYELAKSKKKSAPDVAAFGEYINRIEKTYAKQPTSTVLAMASALLAIGKRSRKLHKAALRVAKKIGPIDFDPDGRCPPIDFAKHLERVVFKTR